MGNNVDYRKLLPACIPHMLKREMRRAAVMSGLHEDGPSLRGMKVAELRDFIIQNATLEQAGAIRVMYPNYFNFTCKEANQAFGYSLTSGQAEYLARNKKLRVLGSCPTTAGHTQNVYAPEGFFALTLEDLNCPDIPDWVNQQMLIKNFGWTKALIRQFLPEPKRTTNPRYRTAPDMKMWHITEVEAIMSSPKFLEEVKRAKSAQTTAKNNITKRRLKAAAEVDKKIQNIHVEVISDKELRQAALAAAQEQLNKDAMDMGSIAQIAQEADEETICRWVVDYIRETLTDYDYSLYRGMGKAGHIIAYERYRDAVLDKISEAYPEYTRECQRQKNIP